MRGGGHAALWCGLAVLLAVAGCRGEQPNPGPVERAAAPPAPTVPLWAEGGQDRAACSCRVVEIQVQDIGTPPLVGVETLERLALAAARAGFGEVALEGPGPGLRLFLEVMVKAAERRPEVLYLGVRGFARTRSVVPPQTFEAGESLEIPRPDACLDSLESAACRDALARGEVRRAVDRTGNRLGHQCRLEVGSDKAAAAALKEADPRVRSAAAHVVAERGLVDQVPRLRELLDDPDPGVRLAVIAALGRLSATEAISDLMRITRGADEATVRAVAVALADMDSPAARRYLEEWRDHHPLTAIRELAAALLGAGDQP